MKRISTLGAALLAVLALSSCEKLLDVNPESEFAPSNVLTSEAGLQAVLYSAYANYQNQQPYRFQINNSEMCTDLSLNSGGNEFLVLSQIMAFTWDASLGTFQADVWAPAYRCIRDANIVLENVDNVRASDAVKRRMAAEARFLRANAYAVLYNWFGTVPLRTSSSQPDQLPRATDDELRTFIAAELTAVAPDLPAPGQEGAFGRATRGAALGTLAKFYLNTKQWQLAADAARSVMDLNYYNLFSNYATLFKTENKGNRELLLVLPCRNEVGYGNWYQAGVLPLNFKSAPSIPDFVFVNGTMANFATDYRLRTAFVNSFASTDARLQLILRSYVNQNNATVNLGTDDARSLKYWDNATLGNNSANDWPILRYADILLTRAEALNELNGPTAEAQALINQVRTRARLANLPAADVVSKDAFRDALLRERAWEFYSEGKRREDLIRHGKFISLAQARGITLAAPKHVLFPIPQAEINANPAIVQTTGY